MVSLDLLDLGIFVEPSTAKVDLIEFSSLCDLFDCKNLFFLNQETCNLFKSYEKLQVQEVKII